MPASSKTGLRTIAALVLLAALVGIYVVASKEKRSASVAATRDTQAVDRSALPISRASASDAAAKGRTAPVQVTDASSVVSSQPNEESIPITRSTAPAATSAPNRADTRATSAPERAATVANAGPVAEEIPLHWGITGNNAERYALRTDRAVVLSGSASAVLEAASDADTSRFGSLLQIASASSFKGKRIELSGYIASVDALAGASIWLRADDASGTVVAFENTLPRGVRGTQEWTYQNIVMDIPKEAVALVYGAMLSGRGKLYVDDLQFRVVDASVPLTAKPITPARHLAQGAISDPGREPRNLDFEETQTKAE